ncbi:MAG TPA: hypothetical protein VK459_14240 [Polyangiaceae bacterium]|nr:hypothetical protein [Polyangiaceae bacterium]
MRSLPHLLLVVVAIASLPALGFADTKTPEAERLKRLTARVNELIKAGHYVEALAPLRDAWAIRQTREIACNLGVVARHTGGDPVEAATFLGRCVEWPAPPATTDEERARRAGLAEDFKEAQKLVARLVVRVDRPGADVIVDGRWIASTSPVDIFLPKGPHQITAKSGENIQTRSVDAPAGVTTVVELSFDRPGPTPNKKPVPPVPPTLPNAGPRRPGLDRITVVGGSVAGGSLVVSGVAFALAESFRIQSETSFDLARMGRAHACATFSAPCEQFAARRDTSGTFLDLGVATAVSAVTIGLATLIYARTDGEKTPRTTGAMREAGVIWSW